MADPSTPTDHGVTFEQDDGFVRAFCACSWISPPCVAVDDAADAYGDHRAAEVESLRAVVNDLAKQDDPSYDIRRGDVLCRYCGGLGRHGERCAWRRARELTDG